MSSNPEYYNESYAPIHDDYVAEQERANQRSSNRAESTRERTEMRQTTSKAKRYSRYDDDNYALPDLDENSSPPTSSTNTAPEVVSSNKTVNGKKIVFTWKCGSIAFGAFVLVLVSGLLAYFFTRTPSGNL